MLNALTSMDNSSSPQRQDPTDAQLRDLMVVANAEGMYDAADIIKLWPARWGKPLARMDLAR